jgi:hypothetical protein
VKDTLLSKVIAGLATVEDFDDLSERAPVTSEDVSRHARRLARLHADMKYKACAHIGQALVTNEWLHTGVFDMDEPTALLEYIKKQLTGISHLSLKAAEDAVRNTRQTHFDKTLNAKVTEKLVDHLRLIQQRIEDYNAIAPEDEQLAPRKQQQTILDSLDVAILGQFRINYSFMTPKLTTTGFAVEGGVLVQELKAMGQFLAELRDYNLRRLGTGKNDQRFVHPNGQAASTKVSTKGSTMMLISPSRPTPTYSVTTAITLVITSMNATAKSARKKDAKDHASSVLPNRRHARPKPRFLLTLMNMLMSQNPLELNPRNLHGRRRSRYQ